MLGSARPADCVARPMAAKRSRSPELPARLKGLPGPFALLLLLIQPILPAQVSTSSGLPRAMQAAAQTSNRGSDVQQALAEADRLRVQGTPDSLQSAIRQYEQALELSRSAGDRLREALCLAGLGAAYLAAKDTTRALDYYGQAAAA